MSLSKPAEAGWSSAWLMLLGCTPFVVAVYGFNYAVAGSIRLSLYDLWWPWDRLGFGPDFGPRGHTLLIALEIAGRELLALTYDLHGVPFLSLAPAALGLLLPPRRRREWFLLLPSLALLLGYRFYFVGSRLYGPRYYYEALPGLLILGARGVMKSWRLLGARRAGRAIILGVLALGLAVNLAFFLPFRFSLLRHLYSDGLNWQVTEAAQEAGRQHALVFMFADDWPQAAAGLLSNDPDLQGNVIYARYLGPESYRATMKAYPDRAAYFWRDGALAPATDPPPEWYPAYPVLRPPLE